MGESHQGLRCAGGIVLSLAIREMTRSPAARRRHVFAEIGNGRMFNRPITLIRAPKH